MSTPTTMVAPHQVGDLVRSFVRVPGSESKKSAKATFCDLGRASTLAATVLIPQNLLPPTNDLTHTPSATQDPSNQHRKRPKPVGKENPAKVTRIEASPADIPIKTIPVTFTAAIHIPSAKVQKLKEENEILRKENEILKKQLSLFKHLIRCYEFHQKKEKVKNAITEIKWAWPLAEVFYINGGEYDSASL